MRDPTYPGVSEIVAANIKRIRKENGWFRSDLALRLNRAADPFFDSRDESSPVPWDEQGVVKLEHGHKGRTPALTVDDLLFVCQALDVSLFDLLLPEDGTHVGYNHISKSFFGFAVTSDMLAFLHKRSHLADKLQHHPEVVDAFLPYEAEWWDLIDQSEDANDEEEARRLRKDADAAFVRKNEAARLAIESIIARLARTKEPEPTDEDVAPWYGMYLDRWASRHRSDEGGRR